MKDETTYPSLSKEEVLTKGQDFDWLLKEGLDWAMTFSGDLWSNFNTADPGVTILQSLCYALTELGYKTHFPIEDILTDSTGQITYDKRFYKAEDILPVNPTTLDDFKRLVLAEVEQVKQVYFNLEDSSNPNTHIFTPYLEVKPSYIPVLSENSSLQDAQKLQVFKEELICRVGLLLRDHCNISQVFLEPVVLAGFHYSLGGNIALKEGVAPNTFFARLIFSLNDYLSPYPVFKRYEDLREEGQQPDDILDGPFVNRGILTNREFPEKRNTLSSEELMRHISQMEEVEWVKDFQLGTLSGQAVDEALKPLTVGYFSYSAFIRKENPLVLLQGGKPVGTLSEARINFELKKLLPKPLPEEDYDDFLPTGKYRDITSYYSIQHHLPELYGLINQSPNGHPDPRREAKVRQLRAYLLLFEQVLANFLSQIGHVGDLFSFESGRTAYQLAGNTYYFQDLYDAPGLQSLLRDVNGYSNRYDQRSPLEDWKAYKRDYLNPYRQVLMGAMEDSEENLDRKSRVLKHLLARYGKKYDGLYLHQNNPGYGDERTSEVVYISDMLLAWSQVSANRIRSYFHQDSKPFRLFSGMEWQAELELQLNAYYQGVGDKILEAFELAPGSICCVHYEHASAAGGRVLFGTCQPEFQEGKEADLLEVYQDKDLLLSISKAGLSGTGSWTKTEAEDYLGPFINKKKTVIGELPSGLFRLRESTKGLVLLDLLRFYPLSYGTNPFSQDLPAELTKQLSLIDGTEELQVEKKGDDWVLLVGNEELHSFESKEEAHMVELTIAYHRQHTSTIEAKSLKQMSQTGRLIAFLPDWVALFKEDEHHTFIQDKLRALAPIYAPLEIYYVPLDQMNELILLMELWSFWELMYRKFRPSYGEPDIKNSLMAYLSWPKYNKTIAWIISHLKENNIGTS